MRRTVTKVFTIADFEEEEIWLREQHKKGWIKSRNRVSKRKSIAEN